MIVGSISIILAIIAMIPCFAPGAISAIGVFVSLLALLISCFSTIKSKVKYLVYVLFIVTFNIFVVSEFSFSLNKYLYSHTETPLRKIIHIITYNKEDEIKYDQSKKALEKHLGREIKIDYESKEKGYFQFVKMVILIIIIPYFLSICRLYYILKYEST